MQRNAKECKGMQRNAKECKGMQRNAKECKGSKLSIIVLIACAFAGMITCGITLTACYKQEDLYVTFESVDALRAASVGGEGKEEIKLGDTVRTGGYYSANDGGGGLYEIVEDEELADNGGTVIKLSDGNFAKLKFGTDNSVNIMQFGAKGDGEADDLPALQAAMSTETGASVVIFPEKKKFVMGHNFIIQRSDLELRGNGSTLVINNSSYVTLIGQNWYSPEFFILIVHSKNITLDGLNILSVHTKAIGVEGVRFSYGSQLGVMYSNGIDILNCTFTSPDKPRIGGSTNVDLWREWHDVRIIGCTLTCTVNDTHGMCLMARNLVADDVTETSSSGCLIEGNTFYKIAADEIMTVGGENARVTDVIVRNNKFTAVKSETSPLVAHSIGIYGDGYAENNFGYANNIVFEDNTFDFVGSMSCFFLNGNLTDVFIRRNTGTFTVDTDSADGKGTLDVMVFCLTGPGVRTNVIVEQNTVAVKVAPGCVPKSLAVVSAPIKFINNNVTVEGGDVSIVFGSSVREAGDNTVHVKGNIKRVSDGCRLVADNKIYATGFIHSVLVFINVTLPADIVFENNYMEAGEAGADGANFLMIAGLTMQGYRIQIAENTLAAPERANGLALYSINIRDTEPQFINFSSGNIIPAYYSWTWIGSGYLTVTND